jgi:hypothetical protein
MKTQFSGVVEEGSGVIVKDEALNPIHYHYIIHGMNKIQHT